MENLREIPSHAVGPQGHGGDYQQFEPSHVGAGHGSYGRPVLTRRMASSVDFAGRPSSLWTSWQAGQTWNQVPALLSGRCSWSCL